MPEIPTSTPCCSALPPCPVPTSANIAGVPSVYGLYGAFLPVLVYAVFGSSKELAVGPVAVTSLLISSSLKEVVPGSVDITNPVSETCLAVGLAVSGSSFAAKFVSL